jgi:hypothetical protein
VNAVVLDGQRGAQDLGSCLAQLLRAVGHHRLDPVRVDEPAPHHLHEARVVGAAAEHHGDVVAVVELERPVEQAAQLLGPRTLLGPVRVRLRGVP